MPKLVIHAFLYLEKVCFDGNSSNNLHAVIFRSPLWPVV